MAGVLLALDFDGVICDSVDECLVTAVNAARVPRGGDLVTGIDQLDARLVAGFRRWRHLVRPAEEYGALLAWLEERPDARPTPASFAAFVRMRGDALVAFGERFFAARRTLYDCDARAWFALHRRFPESVAGWAILRERAEINLVTTMDHAAVRRCVDAWALDIPDERLWTRETCTCKGEAVRRLAAAAGATAADVIFVDDHPDHLTGVAATGARCLWASWGYWPQPLDAPAGSGPQGFDALTDLAELAGWLELRSLLPEAAVSPEGSGVPFDGPGHPLDGSGTPLDGSGALPGKSPS